MGLFGRKKKKKDKKEKKAGPPLPLQPSQPQRQGGPTQQPPARPPPQPPIPPETAPSRPEKPPTAAPPETPLEGAPPETETKPEAPEGGKEAEGPVENAEAEEKEEAPAGGGEKRTEAAGGEGEERAETPEEARERAIQRLMSIKGIGRKRAEKLVDAGFMSPEEIADATLEELLQVDGFGEKLARAVKINIGETELLWDDELEEVSSFDEKVETQAVSGEEAGADDEISAKLLQWSVDGYRVENLERLLKEEGRSENFMDLFRKTEEAIRRIEEIKNQLAEMNVLGVEDEVNALVSMMNDVARVDEIVSRFEELKRKMRVRDIKHELEPLLEVESLADRVRGVLEKLESGVDPDELDVEIKDIRREYKEDFFLSQLRETIEKAKPMEVKRAPVLRAVADSPLAEKKPMQVEDIFLLSRKDYRLIHHVTQRKVTEENRKEVFGELKAIRSFVRHNEKFRPGDLNIIKFGDKIALIQDGQYSLLAMVVKGDVNIWAKKLMSRVLQMTEAEEGPAIASWDGDPSKLPVSRKNLVALLYATLRLGEIGNKQKA